MCSKMVAREKAVNVQAATMLAAIHGVSFDARICCACWASDSTSDAKICWASDAMKRARRKLCAQNAGMLQDRHARDRRTNSGDGSLAASRSKSQWGRGGNPLHRDSTGSDPIMTRCEA